MENEHVIDFRNMPWEECQPGIRSKTCARDNHKIRLVEFSDTMSERDWCTKGHIGYILEGDITIDFLGESTGYSRGDGIYISDGTKHRASILSGEHATIIFVEQA